MLGKAALYTFIRQSSSALISLVANLYLAKQLSPAGMGKYSFFMVTGSLLTTIFSFSIANITARSIASAPSIGERESAISTSYTLMVFAISALIVALILSKMLGLLGDYSDLVLLYLGLYTSLSIIREWLASVCLALEEIKVFNWIHLSSSILFLMMLPAININESNWSIAAALQIASITIAIPSIAYQPLKHYIRYCRLAPGNLKSIYSYGYKIYFANLISFISLRIQYYLIEALLGARHLGAFAIGNSIIEKSGMPAQSIATVLFPDSAKSKESPTRKSKTLKLALAAALITALISLTIILLSNYILLDIIGDNYRTTLVAISSLTPGIIAWSAVRVLASDMAGRGYSGKNLIISTSVLAGVCLSILASYQYGLGAICTAISTSYTLGLVITYILFQSTYRENLLKC
ncbi:oligosaccharide flippase family protein [Hahella sp. NBU794]|uniref:oligosaccharide flippase family protein n=1 Tax=Hahella sp. NBU794 TaxID=3422590 RepID=UPI003D6EF1DA